MPLILADPKTVTITKDSDGSAVGTLNINSIKVVSTPNDNDLNTTTIYPYEGFYDSVTKVFTPIFPLDEYILDQTAYVGLMIQAKAYYDAHLSADPMGIYNAQKIIMYDWLATQLSLSGYTVI